MLRRAALLTVCFLVISGLALAGGRKAETKIATGPVKQISADSLTIQQGTLEFRFVIDKDTKVRGAHKKGESAAITDLITTNQRVMVRYREENGELHATEVRLLS